MAIIRDLVSQYEWEQIMAISTDRVDKITAFIYAIPAKSHEEQCSFIKEQIRQAEQAAYERAAKVCDHWYTLYASELAKKIRALAQQPEEVG